MAKEFGLGLRNTQAKRSSEAASTNRLMVTLQIITTAYSCLQDYGARRKGSPERGRTRDSRGRTAQNADRTAEFGQRMGVHGGESVSRGSWHSRMQQAHISKGHNFEQKSGGRHSKKISGAKGKYSRLRLECSLILTCLTVLCAKNTYCSIRINFVFHLH